MDKQTEQNILIDALIQYGVPAQLEMMYEEVGELFQAINKLKRVTPTGSVLFHYTTKEDTIKYSLAYFNLCSELADVSIITDQIKTLFNSEAISISRERKLVRLQERLNKKQY